MDSLRKLKEEYSVLEPFILDEMKGISHIYPYHGGTGHTVDVIESLREILNLSGFGDKSPEYWQGSLDALLHDSGLLVSAYSNMSPLEVSKNHERFGTELARELILKRKYFGRDVEPLLGKPSLDSRYSDMVTENIMATKVPQNPQNFLEMALCDADIYNSGRDDFFEKGETLRREVGSLNGNEIPLQQWYEGTLKLFTEVFKKDYYTDAARNLRYDKRKDNMKELYRRIEALKVSKE